MKNYSQSYQDLFVLAALNKKRDGTFLDVGCFAPKDDNNTYLLESEFGWTGLCVDLKDCGVIGSRSAKFIQHDATLVYPDEAEAFLDSISPDGRLDYLSLDVDEATNAAIIPAVTFAEFSVITIEHDLYARGKEQQHFQRLTLSELGYILVVPDVHPPGRPELVFEDWWVSPDIAVGIPQLFVGPNDAKEVVETLWLAKFGERLSPSIEVEIHELQK